MDESLIEIKRYAGEGYRPLIDFGSWRVAILRWEQSLQPDKVARLERHTQTDEVFVLLHGQGSLILGGNSAQLDGIQVLRLGQGDLYNVKQNTWHTALLSRDASILIVEESDTGEQNTEYHSLSSEQRKGIRALV